MEASLTKGRTMGNPHMAPRHRGTRGAYIVVNVDLVRSRENRRTAALREMIKEKVRVLNRKHGRRLSARFGHTLGDEWQGVLKSPEGLFSILADWEWLTFPQGVRFGIGVGRIETELSRCSGEMDGQAFHFAREAVSRAKTHGQRAVFRSENSHLDALVNSYLLISGAINRNLTRTEFRRCWLFRSQRSLKRVAALESRSQLGIRQTLSRSGLMDIIRAERTIEGALAEILPFRYP